MKYYKIGFVGSGNLAWHLSQDLEKAGHFIPVIYSRNEANAQLLASQLYDTQVADNLDFSGFELDVLILAVQDDAILQVAQNLLVREETFVVHTSGCADLDVLSVLGDDYGVFYPVQSFTKEKAIDFATVPICIESINARGHEILYDMGKSISRKVEVMDSAKRKTLHLAAVFANNFSNHMFFWAKTLCETDEIDFQLLKPLANETIEKAFLLGPELAQTGPARRGDHKTMKAHLDLIKENSELAEFYKLISKSIQINS
jgi:predicted short-subunit dehydrogenase-like oxidoreductase (DUF2520 family)